MTQRRRGKRAGIVAGASLLITLVVLGTVARRHIAAWWCLRAIDGASEARRIEIIKALGELRSPLAVPKLVEQLERGPLAQLESMRALAAIGPVAADAAAPAIVKILAEPRFGQAFWPPLAGDDDKARAALPAAVEALQAFGPRSIPELLGRLQTRSEKARVPLLELALSVFSTLPREAARAILATLSRPDDLAWRHDAINLLVRLGEPAVPEIADVVQEAEVGIRSAAARALERTAEKRVEASHDLSLSALGKPAAHAIAGILNLTARAQDGLVKGLLTADAVAFETTCMLAAGTQGEVAKVIVPVLIDGLFRHGTHSVTAHEALVELGLVALPDLVQLLGDPDSDRSFHARQVLWVSAASNAEVRKALERLFVTCPEALEGRIHDVLDLSRKASQ